MKSYTTLRNLYGVDTKNTSSANLSYGDEIMNDFYRKLLSKADWPFLHRLRTVNTVVSTTFVNLPYDVDLVESVFVTVSSTRHNPKPSPSRRHWDKLHYSSYTSDIPEYWFVYNGQIGLWPKPASSNNVISINARIKPVDINIANYTTGNIDIITNGSVSVTGAGSPAWTTPMTGRWLRVTHSNTAASSGDGQWYEISSIDSSTTLTLIRKYGGTSLTTGAAAAYIIGQMPLLPEAFQDLPELYGAYRYWMKEKDKIRLDEFKSLLTNSLSELLSSYGINDLSLILDDGLDDIIINPN